MTIIERAKDFIYVCDFYGYAHGKKYYISKLKKGYVANQEYANVEVRARTLKELAAKIQEVTV